MNWVILVGLALFLAASMLRDAGSGWHIGGRNGSLSFSIADGDYRLRVEGEGRIELAPDASGVAALADGGYLDVTIKRGRTERRVRFDGEDGVIERRFWIDGDEQPWTAEADRFLAEAMPIVLRETAINVDERVAWLLANRGHEALIDEIDLIRSDFAQRQYTVRYAESAPIAAADFARLMTIAETHMGSDFDLRTALIAVHEAQAPTGERLSALIAAGRSIGSDFDARTLLEAVSGGVIGAPEAAAAYFDVAATIGSDFDMRHALLPIVTQADIGDEVVARALETAGSGIGSDFDLRSLLAEAAARIGSSDTLARAYVSAASSIGSDFDHKEALMALADRAALTPAGWRMLLESAQGIGGDFECAALLMAVAPRLPRDDEVLAAYRATLATVGSDFERLRAAAALEAAAP